MKKNFFLFFSIVIASLFFSACIKDTDFDQTDDIEITPALELDFVFFTLDANRFYDIDAGEYNLVVSDTTDFTFLNDEFTSENLLRAEFLFKSTNSLPVDFISKIDFLNASYEVFYTIQFPVNSGTINNPTITEFIQVIEGNDMELLTQADKVIVSINASTSVENLEGVYKFQSKTAYYLKVGL